MKKTFLFLTALLMLGIGQAWGANKVVTLTAGSGFTSKYEDKNFTVDEVNFAFSGAMYNTKGTPSGYAAKQVIQLRKSGSGAGTITSSAVDGYNIASVAVYVQGTNVFSLAFDDADSVASSTLTPETENVKYTTADSKEGTATANVYTFEPEGTAATFNIVNDTKANYFFKIVVTYEESQSAVILDSLVIKGTASKMEYEVGEAFDPAGLEVWGIFTKIMKGDSTSQITSGFEWSINPETFDAVSENESVTLYASYKDKTTADTTIAGIKVTEPAPLSEYATIYTSNIEYGGSDTVIYDQVKYGAKKMAKNTPATITVPAGTKTLHIHVAAWNKEGSEWTISGLTKDVKITAVADAGVAGSGSVFTLQNDPATNDYFAIETNNNAALTLTITLPKDKRGVIFGINAELQEGVIAAPAFAPSATDFDESVEVSLTCETEGAAIYYTLDGSEPTAASTLYEAAFTLTDTTTVKAIAIKDGKSSAVAEKTYNLVPAYTLAELVAAGAPTEAGTKVVLVLNNEEITKLYAKSGDLAGIFVKSGAQEVEIYQENYLLPKTWKVGGTVSGRIMGDWVLFNSTWELKIAQDQVANFSYTAPDPTALQDIIMHGNVRKLMHRGHIMILKDNKLFNLQGCRLK